MATIQICLRDVIEGKYFIKEKQAGVGNTQLVFGVVRKMLDLADSVVSEETYRAGGERRKSGDAGGFVAAECLPQYVKNVALNTGSSPGFGDINLLAAGDNALIGIEPDERIAADLLTFFDRLQKEALSLLPSRPQKGRYGSLEIGREGAVDGDERVLLGKCRKFLATGLNETR